VDAGTTTDERASAFGRQHLTFSGYRFLFWFVEPRRTDLNFRLTVDGLFLYSCRSDGWVSMLISRPSSWIAMQQSRSLMTEQGRGVDGAVIFSDEQVWSRFDARHPPHL
jgi:hypothetical protein